MRSTKSNGGRYTAIRLRKSDQYGQIFRIPRLCRCVALDNGGIQTNGAVVTTCVLANSDRVNRIGRRHGHRRSVSHSRECNTQLYSRACGAGAGAILLSYSLNLKRTVWKVAIEIGRRPQEHLGREAIFRTICICCCQVGECDGTGTIAHANSRVRTVDNHETFRNVGDSDGDNGFRAVDIIC